MTDLATLKVTTSMDLNDMSRIIAIHVHGHALNELEAHVLAPQLWHDAFVDHYGDCEDCDDPDVGSCLPEWGFEIRWRWLRHIPGRDDYGYGVTRHEYFSRGGPGAQPVVSIEPASEFVRCAVCPKASCVGVPEEHWYIVGDPIDVDDRGYIRLCRDHLRILEDHRHAIMQQVHQRCPDCGHSLGVHERYDYGTVDLPCGFAYAGPGCPCTHPSPHSAMLDTNDLVAPIGDAA